MGKLNGICGQLHHSKLCLTCPSHAHTQLVVPAYSSLAAQIQSHREQAQAEHLALKQRVLQVGVRVCVYGQGFLSDAVRAACLVGCVLGWSVCLGG